MAIPFMLGLLTGISLCILLACLDVLLWRSGKAISHIMLHRLEQDKKQQEGVVTFAGPVTDKEKWQAAQTVDDLINKDN